LETNKNRTGRAYTDVGNLLLLIDIRWGKQVQQNKKADFAEVKIYLIDYLLNSNNLSLNVNNILLTFSSNFIGSLITHR